MSEPYDFFDQVILNEIAGKSSAIHAYDRILWIVRSGYLTLFGVGTALVLSSMVRNERILEPTRRVVASLLVAFAGLAIGAFAIDRNYTRRKFRVIAALDAYHESIVASGSREPTERGELRGLLTVSGDANNRSYRHGGYRGELHVGQLVYSVPITVFAIGAWLAGLV